MMMPSPRTAYSAAVTPPRSAAARRQAISSARITLRWSGGRRDGLAEAREHIGKFIAKVAAGCRDDDDDAHRQDGIFGSGHALAVRRSDTREARNLRIMSTPSIVSITSQCLHHPFEPARRASVKRTGSGSPPEGADRVGTTRAFW